MQRKVKKPIACFGAAGLTFPLRSLSSCIIKARGGFVGGVSDEYVMECVRVKLNREEHCFVFGFKSNSLIY